MEFVAGQPSRHVERVGIQQVRIIEHQIRGHGASPDRCQPDDAGRPGAADTACTDPGSATAPAGAPQAARRSGMAHPGGCRTSSSAAAPGPVKLGKRRCASCSARTGHAGHASCRPHGQRTAIPARATRTGDTGCIQPASRSAAAGGVRAVEGLACAAGSRDA